MSGILLAARHALPVKKPIVLPNIGDAFYGGYYAGIIDTTKGNILSGDAATVGQRFALICSPISLEFSTSSYRWDSVSSRTVPLQTRWDGLGATTQYAAVSTGYEAFKYALGLTYPSDGASAWYVPALDEMDLLFKNFKPMTNNNYSPGSATTGGGAPASSQTYGYNPSSDPTWPTGYTSVSPAQTSVAVFKSGGAQALGAFAYYRSCTEFNSTNSWRQDLLTGTAGYQHSYSKSSTSASDGFRPVRRLVLA